jgi:glycerol-3-phosphate acyltransferase PlsY
MYFFVAALVGYLIGAIPFGYIIARIYGIRDIRLVGSGNVGAANVWRSAGPSAGILVLIFDIGKGVAAVLVASFMPATDTVIEYLKLTAGFAAVMGHVFPVYLSFRGGKGVNTALGVMITLLPVEALIALTAFIITVVVSRYISLGSVLASIAFFAVVLIRWLLDFSGTHTVYVPASFLLVVLIVLAHRSNIKRLLSGDENRFSFHSRKTGEVKENV